MSFSEPWPKHGPECCPEGPTCRHTWMLEANLPPTFREISAKFLIGMMGCAEPETLWGCTEPETSRNFCEWDAEKVLKARDCRQFHHGGAQSARRPAVSGSGLLRSADSMRLSATSRMGVQTACDFLNTRCCQSLKLSQNQARSAARA